MMGRAKISIVLKGIKINSEELFRKYFDFEEIYELLKRDAFQYRMFVESVFSPYVRMMLFGYENSDGSKREQSPICLMEEPERCEELYPLYFEKCPDGFIKLKTGDMARFLEKSWECADYNGDISTNEKKIKATEFSQEVRRILEKISEGGKHKFSPEGAVAIFLYFLLHIQAGLIPGDAGSEKALLDIIRKSGGVDTKTERSILAPLDESYFEVGQFYNEEKPGIDPIELVRIENGGRNRTVVGIRGCTLQRGLRPGEKAFALRKAGKYIGFLPRFFVIGDTVILIQNGRLCAWWDDNTSYLNTDAEEPVCWAHSNEYGTLILNQDGNMDENSVWLETFPSKSAVSVSAFGMDYCILLEDGSVESRLLKKNWGQVLYAWVGCNGGVAICADRMPMLANGQRLSVHCATEARTWEERWICLDADGKTWTDSDLTLKEKGYSVGVCRKGYFVAKEDSIGWYDFKNYQIGKLEASATDIMVSDELVVCYDKITGQIKRFKL